MDYIPIWSYDNYVPAHIALGKLREEGFDCWLKDENTVTIDPILSNAIGGIKLMVHRDRAEEAWNLLKKLESQFKASILCPRCGSHDIELVSTPRKPSNWIMALFGYFMGGYALSVSQVYHCFKCGHEFPDNASTTLVANDLTNN